MPALDSSPPVSLDTSAIAGIGSERSRVGPIDDFMAAFRSGFITVDDLNRRAQNQPVEASNRKVQLAADDLKRRQIRAQAELLPRQQALAEQELTLAETAAPARQAQTAKDAQRIQDLANPATRAAALNQTAAEAAEDAYVQFVGPIPDSFTLNKPAPIEDFKDWYSKNKIQPLMVEADNFQSGFPLNSPEDNAARAEFVNRREQELRASAPQEYQQYRQVQAHGKAVVPRGTPEYDKELQARLKEATSKAAIQGAQLKALPGVLEKQATAQAEAPAKTLALAQSNRKDYSSLDEIQALRKVDAAANKVRTAVTAESSPFQDMSAIFGFMKVLDPGSTVREGEYATAENARAVPETIKNFYNKVLSGTKLTEEQRTQLLTATQGNLAGQVKTAAPRIKQYVDIEKQLGVAPGEIVPKEDQALLQNFSPTTASGAPPTAKSIEELVGQRVTLKDGRSGVVVKNPDGTFSLK